MAGRIGDADKERVRDANPIEAVVAEYVALKPAGRGSLKGLCPFHDEKTSSFQVSPPRGTYHCFGCGVGGDVFSFVAEIEHLSFVEAVERLAERAGVTITRVAGGSSVRGETGSRRRLLAATKAAAEFYTEQLATQEAAPAREFLTQRGFDAASAAHFGCGYAPSGWDRLVKTLTQQGFSLEELYKAGLAKMGQRGPIDAFHRRLLWSIREPSGDVVGFGARRLYDDDKLEAKYVNTAETPLYRKSQLLFGLDLARREISRSRQVVVVEGYTDVMAMHVAGVPTAVATCGTAFADEHISVLRRYLLDEDVMRGKVIYTFDGDAAGQKAALKAFDSDQRFAANTFIAVAPDGMDPCELRQRSGDSAVRALVESRTPLFAFAIRAIVGKYDLETSEGRVAALREAVPVVARIRENQLRMDYARQLAGWVGSDVDEAIAEVRRAASRRGGRPDGGPGGRPGALPSPGRGEPPGALGNARRPAVARTADAPHVRTERELLRLVLQRPDLVAGSYQDVRREAFSDNALGAIHDAVLGLGGPQSGLSGPGWITAVAAEVCEEYRTLVTQLAVEPLLLADEYRNRRRQEPDVSYASRFIALMAERVAAADQARLRSALQRAEADQDRDAAARIQAELHAISNYRRALAERGRGDG